jgi:hypothetical protein
MYRKRDLSRVISATIYKSGFFPVETENPEISAFERSLRRDSGL